MPSLVKGLLLCGAIALAAAAGSAQTSVSQSVHNLSSIGPGDVKASSDVGVCIFCHAPHHNAGTGTGLWNKQIPGDVYTPYTSTTYPQTNNPISTNSKLCLTCHDGTIALGQTLATGDLGVVKSMPAENSLGQDLARDHPVSFNLPATDDGELKLWLQSTPLASPDPTVKLYDGRMECLTCHDPHVPDNDTTVQKFLVRTNQNGGLCLTCHDTNRGALAGFTTSQHALATNSVLGNALPYPTVAQNACGSCHGSHNTAGTGPRLLHAVEEAACVNCHGSSSVVNPAPPDVLTGLSDTTRYSHPVVTVSGVHDPAEALPVSTRHAECADCHNPHAAKNNAAPSTAPALQQALLGATGVSSTGSSLAPATNEYEVCFKCHAGSSNKPQQQGWDSAFGRTAYRQSMIGLPDPYNAAEEFKSTIARHNVALPFSGASVPSLRANMRDLNDNVTTRAVASGNIYCSDCHNSELARSDGGAGASGPHSSKWQHLLERRYEVNTPTSATAGDPVITVPYSTGVTGPYALCDKCHDVDGYLINGADVGFGGLHKRHVQADGMACSSCHAGHGIQGGDTRHHGNLIDPDTAIVGGPGVAMPADTLYINTAMRTCNLMCHGHQHLSKSY